MSESLSTDRTFFSAGTRLEGVLEVDGEVSLDGQVNGKVTGTGLVTIGEHADLQAEITAPTVVVHGTVRGEIHATESLQLHKSAKVKGLIAAARLRIDEGAVFEGECRMGTAAATETQKPAPAELVVLSGPRSAVGR